MATPSSPVDTRDTAHYLTTKWIELDDTIRRSNEMVLAVKKEKEQVEAKLISYLASSGYTRPSLKLGNETNLVDGERKGGLSISVVEQALTTNGVVEEQKTEILSTIERIRVERSKTHSTLVRKKPRQPRRNRTRRRAVVE